MNAKDIARELNLSATTVSRALSGKGRVSSKTAELVKTYAHSHGYFSASEFPKNRTQNIGIVFPYSYGENYHSFFLQCLVGAQTACQRNGYDLMITSADNKGNSALDRIVNQKKIDGIILARAYKNDWAAALLESKNIPFVIIGSSDDPNVFSVDQDNYSSCKELTEILISKGNERLFLIGGKEEFNVNQIRLQGFLDACKHMSNRTISYHYLMNCDTNIEISNAVRFALRKDTDCIICMDDHICLMALNELERRDLDIPLDIKIASFFNSEYLEHNSPPITSIIYDNHAIGEAAVEKLLSLIKNNCNDNSRKEYLHYEVSMRGSTQ